MYITKNNMLEHLHLRIKKRLRFNIGFGCIFIIEGIQQRINRKGFR